MMNAVALRLHPQQDLKAGLEAHMMPGCLIYTTAEIIIGILPHLSFRREPDAQTGYPKTGYLELVIYPKSIDQPKC
jgi:uncharacterized protein